VSDAIEVHVDIDGTTVRAGTLYAHRRRNTEAATLVYDADYVGSPTAYALEPALTLDLAQHQTAPEQPLFGAFTDCAPDRWGRTLVQRAERRRAKDAGVAARQLGEIDYLLGVRDDLRQGALRFRTDPDGPFESDGDLGVPALTQLGELLHLANRAERDAANYDELRRLIRAGSSLGGARPKAHVRAADGRVAIAKFPSASVDTWNVPAWEKVAHDLAAAAGITVPSSELLCVDRRHVIVLNRFDRDGDRRVGYASAMTMLEARDREEHSYLEIADVITAVSPQATTDLHELWRRIAFHVLISNTDDHLRNHAFLHHHADQWVLSPAFDLNPNPDGPRELCLAIDEADPTATINNVRSVASYFRLSDQQAQAILTEVATAVSQWRTVAATHGLTERDIDTMAPAFDEHELSVAFDQ
jgi:serine/threonine-protein kinase HipA